MKKRLIRFRGKGFRVQGSGFRVQGLGVRVIITIDNSRKHS